MENYTELLKEYLGKRRDCSKDVFKLAGRIYRGANNNSFTLDEALAVINRGD